MKFVRGKRKKIDRRVAQANRNFPDCLHSISVKKHAFPATNLSDFFDWKQHAGLVVRPHYRNKRGFRAKRGLQLGEIDRAISIHTQKCHRAVAFFEVLAWAQNSAVFHSACHDVSATADSSCGEFPARLELSSLRSRYGGVGQRGTNYRVVRFRSAAGKNYFRRRASKYRCQPFTRQVDSFSRPPGERVTAGRVAV